MAKNTTFDPNTLTAPAGKALTITFRNEDATAHSFHLFAAPPATSRPTSRPGRRPTTLHVTLQVPASYNYQCDVHPGAMKGKLVVVKDDAS